ncbi:MAG: polymer-forming cytoskeletal protein [Bacteroidales bacterium]|nr:polymer-forming cytoskeletal protein [Bacteroidales bacterium]
MAIESTQVNEICRISRGTSITGDITSISDIRVDGQVEGKLYTNGKLVVGENAYVSGKIACQTCDVWGKISGDIYVQDIINLKAISSLDGTLHTHRLGIDVGTQFNGTCEMIDGEKFKQLTEKEFPVKETIECLQSNTPKPASKSVVSTFKSVAEKVVGKGSKTTEDELSGM